MSFANGELFHIEMKNGIFQVLDFYKAYENGNIYYFRKVFDGKLNFKVSKAEIVHESWMSRVSAKTQEKISEMINMPEVQAILNDLTIDRMMTFGSSKNIEIKLCTMDPKKKNKLEKLIGQEVVVYVDRPLGSVHPKHRNIIYPVNYGYIKDIVAPDGDYQDAYLLGINFPVISTKGKVYAIVEREDDIEDKLVALNKMTIKVSKD